MVLEEEKKKESLKMHIKNKKAGPHRSFFKPLQTIPKSTFLSGFWCKNCFFFKKNAQIFAYMKYLLYLCSRIELVNQFCIERTINFKSNTTMKKVSLLLALFLGSYVCAYADYTQTLPLDYTDFFRAEALNADGEHLEVYTYANSDQKSSSKPDGEDLHGDQWNCSGKADSRGRSNPDIENSTLSWGAYVDNMKGKAIIYDGTVDETRVSIYSVKRNNDYSSSDGSKSYYLAALVNLSKVSSTVGVEFLSFDGNYTSTTARARVSAKKNSDGGYHIGMEYSATSTESGTTWSNVLAYNETHLIIVKITPNTDKKTDDIESAKLWLDPDLTKTEEENSAALIVSVTGKGIGSVRGINIVQKKNLTGKIAGLRFSDNWEDVAMLESAQEKVFAKFDDGTWGDMLPSTGSYSGGNYPNVEVNGLEMHAAGLQETNNKTAENGQVVKNRICMDNGSRKSMVILPIVNNIKQINVYATPGGDDRDIKLQRWDNATSTWVDEATYNCPTKNVCYFFRTQLNRSVATKLRLVNASTAGGVYVWKIETLPIVELNRIATNFSDSSVWGVPAKTYESQSSEVAGFQLIKAVLVDKGIYYEPSGERFSPRVEVESQSNGGMIICPAVTGVYQVDVYASVGGSAHTFTLDAYDYNIDKWATVETFECENTNTCYRFSKVLNSDQVTKLRITNADGSAKYIWKIVTYPTVPVDLEVPTNPKAVNIVTKSFTAQWEEVSNASGYRIVVFKENGDRQTTKEITGAGITQFNITGLAPATAYTYKVAAVGDGETTVDSELSAPVEVTTAAEITDTYTRTVTNGNYGTICLPKASEDLSTAGAVFFEVAGKVMVNDQLSEIVFDEVTSLVAGKPYVFLAKSDELNIPLVGDAVDTVVTSGTKGLKGSFTVRKITGTADRYVLSNNLLYCTNGREYYVGENRAYFDIRSMSVFDPSAPKAPGRRRVSMKAEPQQTPTGIGAAETGSKPAKLLLNGSVVIIRNGVQYDITGQRIH